MPNSEIEAAAIALVKFMGTLKGGTDNQEDFEDYWPYITALDEMGTLEEMETTRRLLFNLRNAVWKGGHK